MSPSEEQLVPRPSGVAQRPADRPATVAPMVQQDLPRGLGAAHTAPDAPRFPSLISFIIPVLILAGGYFGMLALGTPKQEQAPIVDVGPALVETIVAKPYRDPLVIEANGVVYPFREVQIAAEVAGRVVYKAPECRAGTFVTQGTELIRIDRADYELAARQLENQLHQADVSLQEIDVELESNARLAVIAEEDHVLQIAELDRFAKLSNVVTPSDVDRAKKQELIARNAKATLENQKRLLTAKRSGLEAARELVVSQLEKAKLDLTRTVIVAPVDGVIVKENVEQDSFVQRGSEVLVFEDTTAAEVKCALEMEQLHWIRMHSPQVDRAGAEARNGIAYDFPKMPALIEYRVTGRRDETFVWQGTLERFDGIGLDEKTRTIPCRVVVPLPTDGRLMRTGNDDDSTAANMPLVRGMFVTVRILVPPTRALVELPEEGIRPGDQVWLARDGKLVMAGPVDVFRGSQPPSRAMNQDASRACWLIEEGAAGIRGGDEVIVSPLTTAHAGDAVTTAPPASVATSPSSAPASAPTTPVATPTAVSGEVAP